MATAVPTARGSPVFNFMLNERSRVSGSPEVDSSISPLVSRPSAPIKIAVLPVKKSLTSAPLILWSEYGVSEADCSSSETSVTLHEASKAIVAMEEAANRVVEIRELTTVTGLACLDE